MEYNVAIISPDLEVQMTVSAFFEKSKYFSCTLVVNDTLEFLRYYRDYLEIKIVLYHCPEQDNNGLRLLPDMMERNPGQEIILLSDVEAADWISKAFRYGASGFLKEGVPLKHLENILLQHLRRESVAINPEVVKQLIGYYFLKRNNAQLTGNHPGINEKEKIIRNLLKEGKTYQEIAHRLDMSINGVRYYIKSIYRKYQVNTKAELMCSVAQTQ